jgi:hypothetical protein
MSNRKRARPSAENAVALLLMFAGVMAAYIRLYYGVDIEDEAFYAVLPYRFVLGDLPFVDELNVQQFSAGLTILPVKAWIWLQGSTFGLILFL